MSRPTLTGERVVLRPVREDDWPRLKEILAEPEVARWWNPGDTDHLLADWLDVPAETVFVIELGGAVIGSIEFTEESHPDYRSAGIDLFLDCAHHGRGLGSDALRTMASYLFAERGHHRLTIDPAADNERAIRAYRRVGFRPVGIMRSYERGADGSWHDNLLLDMLPGELSSNGNKHQGVWTMFNPKAAFGGFSVSDLAQAKEFYTQTLGLELEDESMGLQLRLPGGGGLFVYPKDDHQPATFTILNFVVDDIDAAVDELVSRGVQFEQYDSDMMKTDAKGVARGKEQNMGPNIAWFKDPAGNFIAVIEGS